MTFNRVGGAENVPDFAISCTFYSEMNSQFFLLSYPEGSPQWLLCYLLLLGSLLKSQISMQCRIISIQATNFLYKYLQCFMHSVIFRAEGMNFFSFILLPFNTACAQKEHRAIHTIYLQEKLRPHGYNQTPCKISNKTNTNQTHYLLLLWIFQN